MKRALVVAAVLMIAGCGNQANPDPAPAATFSGETHEVCRMAGDLISDPRLMRQASFMTSLRDFGAASDPPVREAATQFVIGWTEPVTATAEGDKVIAYANQIQQACTQVGVTA